MVDAEKKSGDVCAIFVRACRDLLDAKKRGDVEAADRYCAVTVALDVAYPREVSIVLRGMAPNPAQS